LVRPGRSARVHLSVEMIQRLLTDTEAAARTPNSYGRAAIWRVEGTTAARLGSLTLSCVTNAALPHFVQARVLLCRINGRVNFAPHHGFTHFRDTYLNAVIVVSHVLARP
jgi:hypothetical protein